MLYSAVARACARATCAKARDAMSQLADRYGRTGYAPRAALLSRSSPCDQGDKAGAKRSSSGSIDRAGEDELKQVARYRLAEVLLDEKKYDEALAMLDAKHAEPFAGLYADLRGDALAAAGRTDEAHAAYQAALDKFDAEVAVPQLRPGEARCASRRRHGRGAGRQRGRGTARAPVAPPAPAKGAGK